MATSTLSTLWLRSWPMMLASSERGAFLKKVHAMKVRRLCFKSTPAPLVLVPASVVAALPRQAQALHTSAHLPMPPNNQLPAGEHPAGHGGKRRDPPAPGRAAAAGRRAGRRRQGPGGGTGGCVPAACCRGWQALHAAGAWARAASRHTQQHRNCRTCCLTAAHQVAVVAATASVPEDGLVSSAMYNLGPNR